VASKIAVCAGIPGAILVLVATHNVLLAAAAVPVAALYGYAWERLFGDPYDGEELEGVGPLSTGGLRGMADSVYLTAPLGVLVLIVVVVIQLATGHFLWAAATAGATGVAALIARALTETRPPHRRRRRRHPNNSS